MKAKVAVKLISGESRPGLEYAINKWLEGQQDIESVEDFKINVSVLAHNPPDASGRFCACITCNVARKT